MVDSADDRASMGRVEHAEHAQHAQQAEHVGDLGDAGHVPGDEAAGVDERAASATEPRPDDVPAAGDVLIKANLAGTGLFAVTAALAAGLFTTLWQWVAAITALALFAIGVFAFLWSYYNAVQRSRRDVISVTGLYLLLGDPTPARVRRVMLSTLLVQVVVAAITTSARLEGPDGQPGSSLALGFLVPMFGFGLNGLWAAYHAVFPRRPDVLPGSTDQVPE
jgi:hypothetical protein